MAIVAGYADAIIGTQTFGFGEADRINEDYVEPLRQLLPNGPAWSFGTDSDFYQLIRALSYPFARVGLRAKDLLKEFHPSTMRELLSDWERVLGLPGDNPSPPTTIAGRRGAVWGRLIGNGDPSPSTFEELAAGVGYDAFALRQPWQPFTCVSPCNWSLWNAANGKWPWVSLIVTESGANDATLEWLLSTIAPAHGKLLIGYGGLEIDSSFDSWTADDPDGWNVLGETPGYSAVSEVGSGEGHGGSGSGACNMWSADGAHGVIFGKTLSDDTGYKVIVVDISYSTPTPVVVYGADASSNGTIAVELNGVGRHYVVTNVDLKHFSLITGGATYGLPTDTTIDRCAIYSGVTLSGI